MRISKAVLILSILTALFALFQAGAGLLTQGGSGPFSFTTLHGQVVQMNGQGIYAYDTAFRTPIMRGTDAVTLFAALPLLILALIFYRRGSIRGGLLLVGVLSYFIYNAASVALGTAYNNLFLVYTAYFACSLFAFIQAFTALPTGELAARVSSAFPYRGAAALLFLAGAAVMAAWLGDILTPLMQGGVPEIASYTTEVTYVFDLGIITPVCFFSAYLLLRRAPLGIKLSAVMLILLTIVGLVVVMQTVFQLSAGISLTPGQFIGKAGSFMVLALVAIWLLIRSFRSIRA